MKKTFRIIVVEMLAILFGMMAYAAQAQLVPGTVATDRGGNPIYANQEGYYGLNCGCASGNCGNHAVGPMVAGGYAGMPCAAPCAAPCGEVCAAPCGEVCAAPCGEVCAAPCGEVCAAPCGEVCAAPCLPRVPCLPCIGGCGPCGNGGLLCKIWNGRNYWQGPGCSERVIDELRKSWRDSCPQCDLMGETRVTTNTIGTGLRSGQILSGGAPYAPIKMNAGQPEKGFYSAPSPYCNGFSGGCGSCQGGMNFTAVQPRTSQQVVYEQSVPQPVVQQTYAQPVAQTYAQPVAPQTYAQPVPKTYAQPVPKTYAQPATYAQPQTQSRSQVVPAQYQEEVRPVQKRRTSGPIHYRSNYTPSSEVPGYLKAQQNAERTGIGFDSVPERTEASGANAAPQSAWRVVTPQGKSEVVPVAYHQVSDSVETVATPAPREAGSVLTEAPAEASVAYPAVGVPMEAIPGDCGVPCGVPCGGCEMGCAPCGDCGPCGFGCGPCFGCGPYGGMWPGLLPLTADALRFTGRVVYRTGRAAVVGTGLVACGSARAVGRVFWNPVVAGPVFRPVAPVAAGPVGAAVPVDPVYAENDMYLNASSQAVSPAGMQASAVPASNLYESNYYPQNYAVISDTVVSPAVPAAVPAAVTVVPAVPTNTTVSVPASATGSASLLSYQTQRVVMEDGTEVILEHDAMVPASRSFNSSVQYVAANESSAPALSTAVPAGMNVQVASGVSMKAADATSAIPAPVSQVSYGSTSVGALPVVAAPAGNQNPVPVGAVSSDGFPIVASEQPQIQLAPGEVLISQEDFILEPAEPQNGMQPATEIELNGLQPVPQNVPLQSIQSDEETPATTPVRDAQVTKVSFSQPVSSQNVRSPKTEGSILGLKAATPMN